MRTTFLLCALLAAGCDLLDRTTDLGPGGERTRLSLAFASTDDLDNTELYLIAEDGSDLLRLTDHAGLDAHPVFSPDGSRLAFVSIREGYTSDIYIMDFSGEPPVNLTRLPTGEFHPAWSADGGRIAFASMRDGNFELYIMDADGKNVLRLTDAPAFDGYPSFSPDGKKIAFASGRAVFVHHSQSADPDEIAAIEAGLLQPGDRPDFNHQIFVMDADGSNPTRLTNTPAVDTQPSFSPDGKKIAFASNRFGDFEIFVIDADGSNPTRLTYDRGSDTQPAFSPDGKKIAFVSDRFGAPDIFVMNADGSDPRNLTQDARRDASPAWMPPFGFSTDPRCLLCPGGGGPRLDF